MGPVTGVRRRSCLTRFRSTPQPQPAGPAISNGLGTTALILGIIGLALFWIPGLNIVLGVLATTFGAIGYSKARNHTATNQGMAVSGLVLGIITVVGSVVLLAVVAAAS